MDGLFLCPPLFNVASFFKSRKLPSNESNTVETMSFSNVYKGKKVLVTGHTGFKGSWLCEWLLKLGAQVYGLALTPPTKPALFEQLNLSTRINHRVVDVRDQQAVQSCVADIKPDFIFHLAAQPLVRLSYREPVETYATNVMGTVHVLEAVRHLNTPCSVVLITTDKCYENREWLHGYREEDAMGGYDPYSSSKGAAELVIAAYRRSFFHNTPIRIASARAGNVIGGGDWALDRIVPDSIRFLLQGEPIPVRNKTATRPWQHVLEPLSGYLQLGARLSLLTSITPPTQVSTLCSGFNFGPNLTSNRNVAELVQEILKHWPGTWVDHSDPSQPHEASLLNLATDKAFHVLNWRPVWEFPEAVANTVQWYRQTATAPEKAVVLTQEQIDHYSCDAHNRGIQWCQ